MNKPRPDRQIGQAGGRAITVGAAYAQVNIQLPGDQHDLPPPEKFKAFPPEAQAAILAGFQREQAHRHEWQRVQQQNDHEFNLQSERHFYVWKLAGVISGTVLALGVMGIGAYLIAKGASTAGITCLVFAIGGLVGTAIYGQRAMKPPTEASSEEAAKKK